MGVALFIHFISRQGRNILVNIKDISFVVQKGIFCELHIRGIDGHVIVEDDFSNVCQKIKDISPRVNNIGQSIYDGTECMSQDRD